MNISQLYAPKEDRADEEVNHLFCFVELAYEEQADAAVKNLDWKEMWGCKIRVKHAVGINKQAERLGNRDWGQNR